MKKYILTRVLEYSGVKEVPSKQMATTICKKLDIERDAEGKVTEEDLLTILDHYRMSDNIHAEALNDIRKRIMAGKLTIKHKEYFNKEVPFKEVHSPFSDSNILEETLAFCHRNKHKSVIRFINRKREEAKIAAEKKRESKGE